LCKIIFFFLFSFSFLLLESADFTSITDAEMQILQVERQNEIIRKHLEMAAEACEHVCKTDCDRCKKKIDFSDAAARTNDQLFDEIRLQLESQMIQDMGGSQDNLSFSVESTS
ncbi:MAG: putative tellurite resistance protein B-like protein, partial [Halioglobus sp.]